MDLNEFRNKMSSDATEENKRLKAELSKLKKQYQEEVGSFVCEHAPTLEEQVKIGAALRREMEGK